MDKRLVPVRSHERAGVVVPAHLRRPPPKTHTAEVPDPCRGPETRMGLSGLADSNEKRFPDPAIYAASEPTKQDVTRRRTPRVVVRDNINFEFVNHIDPITGEGEIVMTSWSGDGPKSSSSVQIGPGVRFTGTMLLRGGDYRRANLPGAALSTMEDSDFRGATLDDASFPDSDHGNAVILNCVFDGASCRNLRFNQARIFGEVSFRGADLTGASFDGVWLDSNTTLDLRDTNLTSEQLDEIVACHPMLAEAARGEILYPRYSFEEAGELVGGGIDAVGVLAWADELEVRDRHGALVTSDFNASKHFIPAWAI